MFVKVLDGSFVPHHSWVFCSVGTNVGFTGEVLDAHTGPVSSSTSPDLTPAALVQATRALPE